jgi:hypothetical protein
MSDFCESGNEPPGFMKCNDRSYLFTYSMVQDVI